MNRGFYDEYESMARQACRHNKSDPDELILPIGGIPGTETPRWILIAQKLKENEKYLKSVGIMSAAELMKIRDEKEANERKD